MLVGCPIINRKSQIITVRVFWGPSNGSKSVFQGPRSPKITRLRLFVSRNPHFRRAALNLSSWQSSPCGALEVPNDFMNQENRSVLSKFEWLAWPSTADYAVSRLCVFLWIPWNPLEAVESRSRPCRVAVANVLGATKVFSVNLLYGFPARLLVFLVILQSERSKLEWNRPVEGGGTPICGGIISCCA